MSFSEMIIEPQNIEHPDTLVMYPYPIMGNIQNTGSRLQAVADITGLPFVASDLYLQDKKTIFGMPAKEANQPNGETYAAMSEHRAEFYSKIADRLGATVRIGMGDSLAVSAIQGMQLHTDAETFDALLLRDGWNLEEETTAMRGIMRYAKYQIKDEIHKRRDHVEFDIPATKYDEMAVENSETSILEKLKNVADIMRGSHNRDNAVLLAKATDKVMNVVTLKNGLSASNTIKLQKFNDDLRQARGGRNRFNVPQNLSAKIYSGWHSDLMDPQLGAYHLQQTLQIMGKK